MASGNRYEYSYSFRQGAARAAMLCDDAGKLLSNFLSNDRSTSEADGSLASVQNRTCEQRFKRFKYKTRGSSPREVRKMCSNEIERV